MSHFVEIVSGCAIVLAAASGALLMLPREKPDPTLQDERPALRTESAPREAEGTMPCENGESCESDAERVDELTRQLRKIAAEQRRLAEEIRAISAREKAK
jgi:hypothetical protein